MMMQAIHVESIGPALWVRLNRPDVRNAFNAQMIEELTSLPQLLAPETRAVVLCGEGSVFSAGADLNWMKESLDYSRDQNLEDARKLARMLLTLDRLPVPLIGMIHGAAMGGGVGLVSVCDYAIAQAETIFSFSEVKLGIIPACIAPFVLRKIGPGYARSLFTTAERFNAARAHEIGLIHQIAPGGESLHELAQKKVQEIALCGPAAVRLAKQLVFDLLAQPDADQLEMVAQLLADVRVSPEGQEGLRAFLEKRKPKF